MWAEEAPDVVVNVLWKWGEKNDLFCVCKKKKKKSKRGCFSPIPKYFIIEFPRNFPFLLLWNALQKGHNHKTSDRRAKDTTMDQCWPGNGVWAERVSRWPARSARCCHPDEVAEQLSETFRGLPSCAKGRLGVERATAGVPFTLLPGGPRGGGSEDCAASPGLGREEDVDGAPAGLPALSLAESLSCWLWLTFSFLQFGRTRYWSGSGPVCGHPKMWEKKENQPKKTHHV